MPRAKSSKKKSQDDKYPSTKKSERDLHTATTEVSEDEEPGYVPSEQTQWLMGVIRSTATRTIEEKFTDDKVENILKHLIKAELSELKKEMTSEIKKLQDRVELLETDLKKKSRRIERLEFESSKKDCHIKAIKLQVDEFQQRGYDQSLQWVGVPECKDESEDTKQILKLSKDKLGIKLKSSDLIEVKRLGKKRESKTRNIVMKFKDKSVRDKVFECRKKSIVDPNPKNNIYINDRLTQHRQGLLYSARNLVKAKKLYAAWSQYGNILIRKSESSKILEVKDHSDLKDLDVTGSIKTNDDIPDSEKIGEDSSIESLNDRQSIITHLSDYSYYVDSDL